MPLRAFRQRILALIHQDPRAWRVGASALAVGACVVAGIAGLTEHLYQLQVQQRFELLAQERFSRLEERFDDQVQRLDALRRFFVYSDVVSRSEFDGYAKPLLLRTQAYSWVPSVASAERETFERAAQSGGIVPFRIRELGADLQWVPAPPRATYFPVLYSQSVSHLQWPLGFDMGSEPRRRQALERAAASGAMAASVRLDLIGIDPSYAQGLLLAAPVLTAARPGAGLRGFATAIISLRQLLGDGLPAQDEDNLRIVIRDLSDTHAGQPLFESGGMAVDSVLADTHTLHFADRTYRLEISPSIVFLKANQSSAALMVAGLGGMIAILLSLLLYSLTSQRQRALKLVAQSTEQLRHSEQALRLAHGRLSNVLNAATEVAIIATELDGTISMFNPGAQRMLGYDAESIQGQLKLHALHLPAELQARAQALSAQTQLSVEPDHAMLFESLREAAPQAQEWTLVRRDGTGLQVSMLVTAVRDEGDQAVGYLAVCLDITESKRTLSALAARDRLLEQLSAEVPGGIYQFRLEPDGSCRFCYASRGLWDIYQLDLRLLAVDASPVFERIHRDDLVAVQHSIAASARSLTRWRLEYRVVLPGRGTRWVHGEATPEALPEGAIVWHGYLTDITDLKRVEEELRALSVTDALTGIHNRRYFQQRLKSELEQAHRDGIGLAVLMLDVDHFKRINDVHGHAVGDKVLQLLCSYIGKRLRRTDVFCRLGGEEFAILCPGTSADQAYRLGEELLHALRSTPMDGVGIVTASFGVAAWRDKEGADALLLRADSGVYAAKQAGRDRVQPELP